MLEIYNEKVQDLLVPVAKRPTGGLKVREHKVYGVYVEGLTKYPVDSYEAIEAKMDEGSKHRTVAATQMNASYIIPYYLIVPREHIQLYRQSLRR